MLSTINRIVLRYPLPFLAAGLVLTAWFATLVPKLEFSSSSDQYFIEGDSDRKFYERTRDLFGNDNVLVIAMIAPENHSIFNPESMEKLGRLTDALGKVEGVEAVVSLANVPTVRAPLKKDGTCCRRAIEVEKLMQDVSDEGPDFTRLKSEIERVPLYHGNLISRDGTAAAIVAFIADYDDESDKYDGLMERVKKISGEEEGPESFYIAGIPETRVAIFTNMVRDLKRLLPLTMLLILISLIASYRKVVPVVVPLLMIVMTTIWSVGFMEAAGISVTLVSMILPPLMLALGSSYSIHIMSEFLRNADRDAPREKILFATIRKVSNPIIVCGVTTGIGFASLTINRIPAIRNLGIAAVAGVFFTVAIAILIMPAALVMLKNVKGMKKSRATRLDSALHKMADFNRERPFIIYVVAAVLAVVFAIGASEVKIDTDFLSFFPKDSELRKAVDAQTEHLAGAAPFNIVLETNRPGAFKHPELLEKMEELQRWSEKEVKGIDTTLSMADYVKLLNQALHYNDPEYYKVPPTEKEVAQLLLLYSTSSSADDFAPYITRDYAIANIIVRSRLVGSTETGEAIRRIEAKAKELFAPPKREDYTGERPLAQAPFSMNSVGDEEEIVWEGEEEVSGLDWPDVNVRVTGTIYLMNKSAGAVSRGQVLGLLTALAAIFVVMSLMFLSAKIGLLAIIPNVFPIIALFGAMGYLDITLNFSTSLIAAIALGIGVDDTIHYIDRYNREVKRSHDRRGAINRSLTAVGKPMVYTSVTLFLGFLILTVSEFVPIRQFGFLSAMTLVVALIANLTLLPALLNNVSIATLWDLLSLEIHGNPANYVKILNGLSHHQARVAVVMGHLEDYREGHYLVERKRNGSELYNVLSGELEVVMGKEGEEMVITVLRAGEVVGERTITRDGARIARVRARGDVKLLIIDDHTMDRLERRYPRISSRIYYNIVQLLRDQLQSTATKLFEAEAKAEEK